MGLFSPCSGLEQIPLESAVPGTDLREIDRITHVVIGGCPNFDSWSLPLADERVNTLHKFPRRTGN
jgi:hypothetical protein